MVGNIGFSGRGTTVKSIYLTFDDGPHHIHTPRLLNLLMEYEVRATFFVVGQSLFKNKKIVNRIVEEGHVLGNHTQSHSDLTSISRKDVYKEIMECQEKIDQFQNRAIRLFRPPMGLLRLRDLILIKINNFKLCMWTIDSTDWKKTDPENIISFLQSENIDDSVVIFHDDSGLCIEVLKVMLPFWKNKGLVFKLM